MYLGSASPYFWTSLGTIVLGLMAYGGGRWARRGYFVKHQRDFLSLTLRGLRRLVRYDFVWVMGLCSVEVGVGTGILGLIALVKGG